MRFAAGEGLRAAFSLIDDFAGFAARIFGEELLAAAGARVDESLGDELFEDLLEKVWGYDSDADVGSVWVYISYLRKQLAKVGSGVTVKARRGTGYILQEPQG